MVEGKKEFLKLDVLHIGTLRFCEYLVLYRLVEAMVGGHKLDRYEGDILLSILKKYTSLCHFRRDCRCSHPKSDNILEDFVSLIEDSCHTLHILRQASLYLYKSFQEHYMVANVLNIS